MPDLSDPLSSASTATLTLLAIGLVLGLSILCDAAARRLRLPRVTILVLAGVAIAAIVRLLTGQEARALTAGIAAPLLDVALVMVAFLLGGDLTAERWRRTGRAVLGLSLSVMLASGLLVGGGLLWLGYPAMIALPLAAMAVATDPAAVQDVVDEVGGGGRRGEVLRGVVAIDDAWGIIAFGIALAALGWLTDADGAQALLMAGWELGGSIVLGCAVGVPAAYLTGRLRPGQPTQAEALAIILLIAALADILEVSSLLAGMTAGVAIANLGRHHERSFREIEQIEWPFLVLFFVAAGAAADPKQVATALPLIIAYVALRAASRLFGGWAARPLLRREDGVDPGWLGLGLMPQAGVAMGMALLVAERYPAVAGDLVAVAVAATIIFETLGPVLTRRSLG
jgi:Kef-type K+ transport system membrane component KefB